MRPSKLILVNSALFNCFSEIWNFTYLKLIRSAYVFTSEFVENNKEHKFKSSVSVKGHRRHPSLIERAA